jgi:hypothetical protein
MTSRPLSALRAWIRHAWFTLTPWIRNDTAPRKTLFPKAQLLLDHYDPRESFNSVGGTVQMALVGGGFACLAQSLWHATAPAAELTVSSTPAAFGTHEEFPPVATPAGGGQGEGMASRRTLLGRARHPAT